MAWAVALAVAMFASAARAAAVHVSPGGNDANDGSAGRPVATLERARDVLRAMKDDGQPRRVVVHAGTYVLSRPLELGGPDSGVTWEAAAGEEVRVSGGPAVSGDALMPAMDERVLSRLKPDARGKVVRADLGKLGELRLAEYPASFRGAPAVPEVFFNDRRMTVARWPNDGWATVAKIVQAGATPRDGDASAKVGAFEYSGDEPARWDVAAGVWLQGYWCFDWYDETIRVRSIDREHQRITLDAPATYGVRQGNSGPRRFRAINVLEELDEPGEYYLDRAAKAVYLIPPGEVRGSRVVVSTLDGPLVRIKGAHDVALRGMTLEASLGNGVEVTDGQRDVVDRCVVRNARLVGVVVTGGDHCRVSQCEICETGTGGVTLEGGDRRTLTPSGHEAVANHIHGFSRLQLSYANAITLGGVGNRAAHNLIHDAPHEAVAINGNDHFFEYNIVRDVVTASDDAGALYKGRNPSCRGNLIRYNLWQDIGRPAGLGTAAIYFDDGDGGDTIYGNVFVRCGSAGAAAFGAIFSHGGHDLHAENNVFVDCPRALGSAPWDDARWKRAVGGGEDCGWTEKLLKEVDITKPPYTTRYPELVGFMDPKPGAVRKSWAKNNVLVRCPQVSSGNWSYGKDELFVTSDDPGFVDAAKGNYALRADSEVFRRLPGFKAIPFERIGPQGWKE